MSTLNEQVGRRIRALRLTRGLRQEDLAQHVGMTRSSIANLEAGRQNIGIEQLAVFARHLGVEPADLLTDNGYAEKAATAADWVIQAIEDAEERAIAAACSAIRQAFANADAALARGYTQAGQQPADRQEKQ